MKAGAKSHAWLQADDQLAMRRLILFPSRHDDRTLSNALQVVLLLPGFGPILLSDRVDNRFRDGIELCQMPKPLLQVPACIVGRSIQRQVGLDDHGRGRGGTG